ncbi:MAG TPA: enoyl-CoA hydratase-related protein [Pseudomonadales bacterium]|jgi:enoyl-CoA hydratase|nr:enoyl-CoA hydratase-related protein [Pseudomonadales bacterium]
MDKLHYQIQDSVCTIHLDDGKVNAMNLVFFEELHAALDQAEKFRCRAVVIDGREGVFSAGLDLKYMPTLEPAERARFSQTFARAILRLYTLPIPSVAAIAGHAIAGGAILAFACDCRYALDGHYLIQLNEIKNRMALPNWMSLIASTVAAPATLTQLALHARAYRPREAFAAQLLTGLAGDGNELNELVQQCCRDFFEFDPASYATTKRWMRNGAAEQALSHLKDVQATLM